MQDEHEGNNHNHEDHQSFEAEMFMEECIQDCLECHAMCLAGVGHSLDLDSALPQAEHIRLLLDCAEICQTSANFMLRGSDLHGLTCSVCAEVCDRCADACAVFTDDELLQDCADTCRTTAQSCRHMAAMALPG
jgi:hypothetical protein